MSVKYWLEWVRGLYYGIPICCIRDFVEDLKRGFIPGTQRTVVFGQAVMVRFSGEYVPCRRCAYATWKSMYEAEMLEEIKLMIDNCPRGEMPYRLQILLEDRIKAFGDFQAVRLEAIEYYLKGKI